MKLVKNSETAKQWVAVIGLLLYPFFQFIKYQNYPFWRLEVGCLSAILVALASIAFIIVRKKRYALCALYALLITGIMSSQMTHRDVWHFVLAGVMTLVVFFLLTRFAVLKVATLVLLFLVGMTISDLVIAKHSRNPFFQITKTDNALSQTDQIVGGQTNQQKKPSHILYILTDEFIGLNGMPENLSGTEPLKRKLLDFYLPRGFTIFPKAYSPYFDTVNSLSNILNFSSVDQNEYYYATSNNDKAGFHLNQNKFFDWAQAKGYKMDVYQTAKLDLCSSSATVGQCVEYSKNVAQAVEGNDLALGAKVWVLGSQFIVSHVLISELVTPLVHRNILQPYTGPLKVVPLTLARFRQDVLRANQNTFFYVYLGMPHFPYVYDRSCHVRPVNEWQHRMKMSGVHQKNTEESYALKYERYYEQIECLQSWLGDLFMMLQDAGLYDAMTIIVHGDHGSRINMSHDPRVKVLDEMSQQDIRTSFSTFLAIKKAGQRIGNEHFVQGSLKNIIKSEIIDGQTFTGEDSSFVYFKTGSGKTPLIRVPWIGDQKTP